MYVYVYVVNNFVVLLQVGQMNDCHHIESL